MSRNRLAKESESRLVKATVRKLEANQKMPKKIRFDHSLVDKIVKAYRDAITDELSQCKTVILGNIGELTSKWKEDELKLSNLTGKETLFPAHVCVTFTQNYKLKDVLSEKRQAAANDERVNKPDPMDSLFDSVLNGGTAGPNSDGKRKIGFNPLFSYDVPPMKVRRGRPPKPRLTTDD